MTKKQKKSNLVVIDRDPPNLILVGMLQNLLDRAKRGEVYGAVIVTESKDSINHILDEVKDHMKMIGALEFVKMRLLMQIASHNTNDATDSSS